MKDAIREKARAFGFDLFGVARAGPAPDFESFQRFVAEGRHGSMRYLEKGVDVRGDPRKGFPWAASIICLGRAYDSPRLEIPAGWIAAYARARDYHKTIKEALRKLTGAVRGEFPRVGRIRAFVDTGPVAEKAWAARAGLGFLGKNTLLIAPGLGSRLHLAVMLLEAELPPDAPEENGCGCGECRRCVEACPTGALISPWRLDARRCISYLTVETKGDIPWEEWPKVRSVFGCDICQDVCPFNRNGAGYVERGEAPDSRGASRPPHSRKAVPETCGVEDLGGFRLGTAGKRPGRLSDLADLIEIGRERFEELFGDTPVRRATWSGLRLNAITAAGNAARDDPGSTESCKGGDSGRNSEIGWGDKDRKRLADALKHCLYDEDRRIVERARWALARCWEANFKT